MQCAVPDRFALPINIFYYTPTKCLLVTEQTVCKASVTSICNTRIAQSSRKLNRVFNLKTFGFLLSQLEELKNEKISGFRIFK